MCGRFTLYTDNTKLSEYFQLVDMIECAPSYNVAPGALLPVVFNHEGKRVSALFKWGLLPSWSKPDMKPQFNARVETIHEKPFFRESFKKRRCLIPANGWYEWQAEVGHKQPYYFTAANSSLIAFAGVWDICMQEGEPIYTFTIITTQASAGCNEVHARMPLIVKPQSFNKWLSDELDEIDALESILRPKRPEKVQYVPVSKKVGSPRYNDRTCIQSLDLKEFA